MASHLNYNYEERGHRINGRHRAAPTPSKTPDSICPRWLYILQFLFRIILFNILIKWIFKRWLCIFPSIQINHWLIGINNLLCVFFFFFKIIICCSTRFYLGPGSDISEEDLSELPSCAYAGRTTQHVSAHTSPHAHSHSPLQYHMPIPTQGKFFCVIIYIEKQLMTSVWFYN